MLRPSRPMIRPFMSSEGSSTSVTVVSAAALAATRCSASATRLRARRFASVAASSSSWRTRPASSWRTCSSDSSRIRCRASPRRHRRDPLELAPLALAQLLHVLLELLEMDLRSAIPCSRRVELGELPVDVVLLCERRAPRSSRPRRAARAAPSRARCGASPPARASRSAPRAASPRLRAAPRRAAARACGALRRAASRASSRSTSSVRRFRRRCDHDCHGNEHGRSLRAVARTTLSSPIGVRRRARRAPVVSAQFVCGRRALRRRGSRIGGRLRRSRVSASSM